jgi:cytochrome c oxidase subunit 3
MSTENEAKPTEKRDFANEISTEVKEKMKKNLVYVGIFSVIMLFAGFTSGYIVSMGDSFWLKYPMPIYFWLSTASIAFSSLAFILAIRSAKRTNKEKSRCGWLLPSFLVVDSFIVNSKVMGSWCEMAFMP